MYKSAALSSKVLLLLNTGNINETQVSMYKFFLKNEYILNKWTSHFFLISHLFIVSFFVCTRLLQSG